MENENKEIDNEIKNLNVLIEILHTVFNMPDKDGFETDRDYVRNLLLKGGLTVRQTDSILMFRDGELITDISLKISGSKYTQNTSSALSQAVGKFLKAIVLIEAMMLDKELVKKIFQRAAIGSTFKVPLRNG